MRKNCEKEDEEEEKEKEEDGVMTMTMMKKPVPSLYSKHQRNPNGRLKIYKLLVSL